MRRLIIAIFVVAFLAGCGVTKFGVYSVTAIDYDRYTKQGFFITESNSVSFEYEPVSSISALVTDGYVDTELVEKNDRVTTTRRPHNDNVYGTGGSSVSKKNMVYVEGTPDLVTDILVEEAIKMGANGIINFKYTPVNNHEGILAGYTASGMAIKR